MLAEAYYSYQEYYVRVVPIIFQFGIQWPTNIIFQLWIKCFYNINYYSSNLTQSCLNLFFNRTFNNKKMSIDDIKKYFKEDHFTFLVVKANDLYFGFDLSKAE